MFFLRNLVVLFFCLVDTVVAVDGTITIRGEITDNTCKINGAEPPANITVKLPKISKAAIKEVGDVAGATPFDIRLTECSDALNGQRVHIYFEPGYTTDFATKTLVPFQLAAADTSVPAVGVTGTRYERLRIELAGLDGVAIPLGRDVAEQKALVGNSFQIITKVATARFIARYKRIATGDIPASHVGTVVQFSVVYP